MYVLTVHDIVICDIFQLLFRRRTSNTTSNKKANTSTPETKEVEKTKETTETNKEDVYQFQEDEEELQRQIRPNAKPETTPTPAPVVTPVPQVEVAKSPEEDVGSHDLVVDEGKDEEKESNHKDEEVKNKISHSAQSLIGDNNSKNEDKDKGENETPKTTANDTVTTTTTTSSSLPASLSVSSIQQSQTCNTTFAEPVQSYNFYPGVDIKSSSSSTTPCQTTTINSSSSSTPYVPPPGLNRTTEYNHHFIDPSTTTEPYQRPSLDLTNTPTTPLPSLHSHFSTENHHYPTPALPHHLPGIYPKDLTHNGTTYNPNDFYSTQSAAGHHHHQHPTYPTSYHQGHARLPGATPYPSPHPPPRLPPFSASGSGAYHANPYHPYGYF